MKKIVPYLLIINTSLLIVSIVISFIIIFRPFYYIQIKPLHIEENSGLTYNEVKESFDGIMDYSLLNKDFSTGKLSCSKECQNHFKDTKMLFIINFSILVLSFIIKYFETKYYHNYLIKKHRISFWSSVSILSLFITISVITLIVGFNKVFTLFHNIVFLGKTNWLFDPDIDTVIYIFPKQFFINSCIFIVGIISLISIFMIVKELMNRNSIVKGGKMKKKLFVGILLVCIFSTVGCTIKVGKTSKQDASTKAIELPQE